jgi:iron complex outermembrane receptor protein
VGQPVTIAIHVRDQDQAMVQRAAIEASCSERIVAAVQTAADGGASLRLAPGRYRVSVVAPGFGATVEEIDVNAANASVDLVLMPGSASDTVNVSADAGFVPFASNFGSKTGSLLVEVPQSISIISQREIQARNPITVNEALRYTPGVQTDEWGVEQRFDWMKIRGFTADTTGIFRDGMRWNSLAGKMDPAELESIEVLKGPSSVLYGQAPPGGLVNLTTKRPLSETQREVQVQVGSYDRRQVQADFGGPIDKNEVWRYRLIGLVRNSGTQVIATPDDRRLIAPSLTWHPSDRTNVTVMGDWQHDKTKWSQFLPASGTLYHDNPNGVIPIDTFTGEPDWEHVLRNQASLGYSADHLFDDGWNVRQNYRFQHVNFQGRTVYGIGFVPGSESLLSRLAYDYPQWTDIHTLDTRALRRFATTNWQHTVLGGYDYVHLNSRTAGGSALVDPIDVFHPEFGAAIPTLVQDTNNNQLNQQHGAYLQDQVKFRQNLVFTLGGREDWAVTDYNNYLASSFQHQNDSKFTGRAGVTYLTNLGVNPYYSYSTSFQPTTGSTTFDGKLFRPSMGRQHEAGVKIQPRTWNSFITASVFNIDQTNVLTTDPAHPLYSMQAGGVRSRGVELEGVANLARGWNLHASYSLIDTAITEASSTDQNQIGKRFPQTPRNQTGLLGDYTVPEGRFAGWGGNVGVRFVGQSVGDTLNTLFIPNYTLFDAGLRAHFRTFDFNVNATNLGNRQYVSTCSGVSYCGYGFARNVVGVVKYRF